MRRRALGSFALASVLPASAQAPLIVVRGEENYPPYEMLVDGRLSGLHVDLVEAVAARLGLQVQWQSLPWKRALRLVELGQADAVTYIARTPEREAWALFLDDNLLSTAELRFIVRKQDATRIDYDGDLHRFLAQRQPIVARGFQFGIAEIDGRKKFEALGMGDLVRMLTAGYSDVAVVNWSDFVGAYGGKPEFAAIAPLRPPLRTLQNFIAFSIARKDQELARRFAAELAALRKSGEYGTLQRRYLPER